MTSEKQILILFASLFGIPAVTDDAESDAVANSIDEVTSAASAPSASPKNDPDAS